MSQTSSVLIRSIWETFSPRGTCVHPRVKHQERANRRRHTKWHTDKGKRKGTRKKVKIARSAQTSARSQEQMVSQSGRMVPLPLSALPCHHSAPPRKPASWHTWQVAPCECGNGVAPKNNLCLYYINSVVQMTRNMNPVQPTFSLSFSLPEIKQIKDRRWDPKLKTKSSRQSAINDAGKYHIPALASVTFGRDWFNKKSASLRCFRCCNTEQKVAIYLPWKAYFHGSLTFQRGQPPDKRHMQALPWAISCKPSEMRWGFLRRGWSLIQTFCLFGSIDWLHHIAGHEWIYSWCVSMGVVCVGEKGKKDATLTPGLEKWPVFYSAFTSQPIFLHKFRT